MTSLHPRLLCCLAAAVLVLPLLNSCSTLKAGAVPTSSFLPHRNELKPDGKHSPFLATWTSPEAAKTLEKRRSIYLAPVSLAYLRPMKRNLSKSEIPEPEWKDGARKLADYANSRLAEAFAHSKTQRYKLVSKPDKDSLTVELAFVELNPNPLSGGLLRTAVNVVAVPGVDSVLMKSFKGNIAMEGKVLDSTTKKPVYEFADNQENKSALIFSVNDLNTYGQAREAIDEWAEELEKLLRTPMDQKVSGPAAFVVFPWN